jgi:hypothetical protein
LSELLDEPGAGFGGHRRGEEEKGREASERKGSAPIRGYMIWKKDEPAQGAARKKSSIANVQPFIQLARKEKIDAS